MRNILPSSFSKYFMYDITSAFVLFFSSRPCNSILHIMMANQVMPKTLPISVPEFGTTIVEKGTILPAVIHAPNLQEGVICVFEDLVAKVIEKVPYAVEHNDGLYLVTETVVTMVNKNSAFPVIVPISEGESYLLEKPAAGEVTPCCFRVSPPAPATPSSLLVTPSTQDRSSEVFNSTMVSDTAKHGSAARALNFSVASSVSPLSPDLSSVSSIRSEASTSKRSSVSRIESTGSSVVGMGKKRTKFDLSIYNTSAFNETPDPSEEESSFAADESCSVQEQDWLKHLDNQWDDLIVKCQNFDVRQHLTNNTIFKKNQMDSTVSKAVVSTAVELNHFNRPSPKAFKELAGLMCKKNPVNFPEDPPKQQLFNGEVSIVTMGERGRGGLLGKEYQTRRLSLFYYEMYVRNRAEEMKGARERGEIPQNVKITTGKKKSCYGMVLDLAQPQMLDQEREDMKNALSELDKPELIESNATKEVERVTKIFNKAAKLIQMHLR